MQKEREAREAREARNASQENDGNEDQAEEDGHAVGGDDDAETNSVRPAGAESDDDEDPFLKAVGGADKLLTGKAYQEKLLAQQLSA